MHQARTMEGTFGDAANMMFVCKQTHYSVLYLKEISVCVKKNSGYQVTVFKENTGQLFSCVIGSVNNINLGQQTIRFISINDI